MNKHEDNKDEWLQKLDPQAQIESSRIHYFDDKFWSKLLKYSKKAGEKTVYTSLLLYFTAQNPAVPKSAKLTILGALGYLILPIDVIPDFIPVIGLADDASIIAYALYQVISHIDEPTKQRAHNKMNSWFGQPDENSEINDQLLPK
ncbi:YkvA family protein [Paenisporosarcina sp. TG-14]|uniref:YkvA family protein n=1 Tax=Paenisporosarcina sp. TG-14 TaxID=1231057 RepID=UPI0003087A8A|nr:YkvA family protein [Paenisporosarcina sp. TG-14]